MVLDSSIFGFVATIVIVSYGKAGKCWKSLKASDNWSLSKEREIECGTVEVPCVFV